MGILKKLNNLEEVLVLMESGIRRITDLSKEYNKGISGWEY